MADASIERTVLGSSIEPDFADALTPTLERAVTDVLHVVSALSGVEETTVLRAEIATMLARPILTATSIGGELAIQRRLVPKD